MGNPVTLEEGDKAPLFTAEETNGESISLEALLTEGKRVVLYFYPKDSTPGCTVQACDFRDNMAMLTGNDVVVLGVLEPQLDGSDVAAVECSRQMVTELGRIETRRRDQIEPATLFNHLKCLR